MLLRFGSPKPFKHDPVKSIPFNRHLGQLQRIHVPGLGERVFSERPTPQGEKILRVVGVPGPTLVPLEVSQRREESERQEVKERQRGERERERERERGREREREGEGRKRREMDRERDGERKDGQAEKERVGERGRECESQ